MKVSVKLGKIEEVTQWNPKGYFSKGDGNLSEFTSTGGQYGSGEEFVSASPEEATLIRIDDGITLMTIAVSEGELREWILGANWIVSEGQDPWYFIRRIERSSLPIPESAVSLA